MPKFTIEMTYGVPHYRHHTYEAASLEEALKLARADDDWEDQKKDHDSSWPIQVTGAWKGEQAYVGKSLVPQPEETNK
jgi:hypothetical protein